MVNRIFLAVLLVVSLFLPDVCLALDQKYATPLKHLPSDIALSEVIRLPAGDKICGGRWVLVGTVCDRAKLIEYQKNEQSKVALAKNQMSHIEAKLHIAAKLLVSDAIMGSSLLSVKDKEYIKERSLPVNQEYFKGNATLCWNYMAQMRSAGLCTVCSGDSHQYFFNDKALITYAECDRMSKNCKIHFDHFLGLMDSAFSILKASNLISYNTKHNRLMAETPHSKSYLQR